jgi:hypothetical protein
MLTAIQQQRRRSPGWVYHSYLAKFGVKPPVYRIDPMPPTPEVLAWVRVRLDRDHGFQSIVIINSRAS